MLQWREVTAGHFGTPFLKATIVNFRLDFTDLIQGRFWGGHEYYFSEGFSIHERIIKDKGWNYQLLAPGGVHVYTKDVEEAKEIAELMFRRIAHTIVEQLNKQPEPELPVANKLQKALEAAQRTTEQLNRVMWKRHCKLKKFKTKDLSAVLEKRGIVGRVWYSQVKGMVGWMFSYQGGDPQLLGSNYEQALDFIQSGTLDFLKVG
jgi:hypothetical protein